METDGTGIITEDELKKLFNNFVYIELKKQRKKSKLAFCLKRLTFLVRVGAGAHATAKIGALIAAVATGGSVGTLVVPFLLGFLFWVSCELILSFMKRKLRRNGSIQQENSSELTADTVD